MLQNSTNYAQIILHKLTTFVFLLYVIQLQILLVYMANSSLYGLFMSCIKEIMGKTLKLLWQH